MFTRFFGITAILLFWIGSLLPVHVSQKDLISSTPDSNEHITYSIIPQAKSNVDELKIGLLLPEKPENDRLAKAALEGAELAVSLANLQGGNHGEPFELLIRVTDGPWGAGSKEAVSFVYDDGVWAILTALDGRNAHLAEQVITKAHVVQVETRATEETLSEAFVPWFFRIVPNDRQQAKALIDEICKRRGLKNILIINEESSDCKKAAATFRKLSVEQGIINPGTLTYDPAANFSPEILPDNFYDAIVLFGTYDNALPVLDVVRRKVGDIPVFGPLSMTMDGRIGENITTACEGGVFVTSRFCYTTNGRNFKKDFMKKYNHQPTPASSYAFDGMNLLIKVIRQAGPDREKLQETLAAIKFNEAATGPIRFDEHGNRISPVFLVQIIKGHPVILNN